MNKSLIASAIVLAFASAPVFADAVDDAASSLSSLTPASAVTSALSTGKTVSLSALSGSVSNVQISGIGNTITNSGSNGGQGGGGQGGPATGGNSSGSGSAGGAITNGTGASGGNGGTFINDAGTINMSNTLSGAAQSAAGILILNQNTGAGALVQQSVNVQSNFIPGK